MKYSAFVLTFLSSVIFCQEPLIHINKTFPNGKPKEILIYERKNDNLKSTNPLVLIEKITYDRNGNYIKPKATGLTRKAKQMIIGSWARDNKEVEGGYVEFKRGGKLIIYNDFEVDESESGFWDMKLEDDKSIFIFWNEKKSSKEEVEFSFQNNNSFLIDGSRKFYRINK